MSTLPAWLAPFGAFLLSIVALVAFTAHDHKVELVVSWPSTPPTRIWQLLTQHADEPRWVTFFASVKRQPDDQGRPVWTYRDATGSFNATMMTILAVPERRYERILLREPGAGRDAWDVRGVIEPEPAGSGARMRFTEYGWTGTLCSFCSSELSGARIASPSSTSAVWALPWATSPSSRSFEPISAMQGNPRSLPVRHADSGDAVPERVVDAETG